MKPLCVDCDGTLIAADLLHESIVKIVKEKPLRIFQMLCWLMLGRCVLKRKLAEIAKINPAKLPYRKEVIEYLKNRKSMGGQLFLVTAAARTHADSVASYLDIFDDVFSSDDSTNLKGRKKQAMLVEKYGHKGFDYMGDAEADMPVWSSADTAIAVGRNQAFLSRVKKINPNAQSLGEQSSNFKKWFKLIRVHQWAKNLILFVPVVTSHKVLNTNILFESLTAFFSLSFIASATYIINDLFDLDNDRSHARKCYRPLASGSVGIPVGVGIAVGLLVSGFAISLFLPRYFLLLIGLYIFLTISYSSQIKRIVLADAILLAGLYTLRLLIGHSATGIPLSVWLLAFAIFIFFSLALAKRFVEISLAPRSSASSKKIQGRGYQFSDLGLIGALGASSGVVSILVMILYVSSPEVRVLYSQPALLILLAPLFLYWIARIWLLAYRGCLHDDPVLFALRDRVSYAIGLATMIVIWFASIYK